MSRRKNGRLLKKEKMRGTCGTCLERPSKAAIPRAFATPWICLGIFKTLAFPNTNRFLLWWHPMACSVLTAQAVRHPAHDVSDAELAPPASGSSDTGPAGEALARTEGQSKQWHQPPQSTSGRGESALQVSRGGSCSGELSSPLLSGDQAPHPTNTRVQPVLSTPSRGDGAWGTFPPQTSGVQPKARLSWQLPS